jgi:hypothetical protein
MAEGAQEAERAEEAKEVERQKGSPPLGDLGGKWING